MIRNCSNCKKSYLFKDMQVRYCELNWNMILDSFCCDKYVEL